MRDYQKYYELMGANVHEKIDFIIEELKTNDYKKVVDIGCADGKITETLAGFFSEIEFIGVDTNEQVVKSNIKNNNFINVKYIVPNPTANSELFDDKTLVIFSSVLHEIFTFSNDTQIFNLLKETSNAKAIAIRDMRYEKKEYKYLHSLKPNQNKEKMFNEFKEVKGVVDQEDFVEFILKSNYCQNWYEELKENYFSVDWELLDNFYYNSKGFDIVYYNLYLNEFLVNRNPILKDLTHSTHVKIIYKRLS